MNEEHNCEECGQRKATIQLTVFVEGQPVQKHLCDECYGNQDDLPPLSPSKIFAQIIGALAPELAHVGAKQCPECGMTYLEFRQRLSLGCPKDYDVFSEPLDELLERIHGANRHVGKVPSGSAQKAARGPRLEVLRRELEEAVAQERFEQAAGIRDEIKELERDGAGGTEEQRG